MLKSTRTITSATGTGSSPERQHRTVGAASETAVFRVSVERWRRIIWIGCAIDAALCLLFVADGLRGARLISPDSEFSLQRGSIVLPVLISVFMSLMSGLAWMAAGHRERGRSRATVLWGLGIFFFYMALDDFFAFHEHIEAAVHVDWEKLYLPLVAAAGACVLLTMKYYWRSCRPAVTWLIAGGAMWFVAEVLEFVEWRTPASHTMPLEQYLKYGPYVAMMIPEEILECLGSGVWVIAALALLQHLSHRDERPHDALTHDRGEQVTAVSGAAPELVSPETAAVSEPGPDVPAGVAVPVLTPAARTTSNEPTARRAAPADMTFDMPSSLHAPAHAAV